VHLVRKKTLNALVTLVVVISLLVLVAFVFMCGV